MERLTRQPSLSAVPLWAMWTTFSLSIAALGVSGYLTYTHFQPQALLCSTSGVIDCAAVTTSPQSFVFGVPVAVLGLIGYCVIAALNSPLAWRAQHRSIHIARLVVMIGAMAFVLWLVGAELLVINHICEWCTSVHIITFVLFVLVVRQSPALLARPRVGRIVSFGRFP